MQAQDNDIDSLNKFWHWADNERPDRDLFDKKATAEGPLTDEAQEAMQQAVEVVSLRAPDCLHPSGEVLRPAIKAVSFAIMYAWKLMRENPMIEDALLQQAKREDFNDSVRGVFGKNDASKNALTPITGSLDTFCGEDIAITYPDGSKRIGWISKGGSGVYDFKEYTGKAKDIMAKRDLPASPKWKDAEPADHAKDAAGYTAYNMRIPGNFVEAAVRRASQNIGLSKHYRGSAVDLQQLTIIPVIGEMGVTRSHEHDVYRTRLIDMMGPNDREHLSVRVDSRGILFQSIEFNDIEMLCQFSEFETQDTWRIDEHKLYLVTNTLRLRVVQRKEKKPGMRVFPHATNMFDGTEDPIKREARLMAEAYKR